MNDNIMDLMKFVMAFVVVAIHANPLTDCTNKIMLVLYEIWFQ